MKDPFKAITGVSLAGVVALFALYGEKFWESARAAWLFLLQITQTAPLGLASFFAALMLGTMTCLALDRWLPPFKNNHTRRVLQEMSGLAVAVGLSWLQLHQLNGLLFGVLAGLMAPLVARMLLALAVFVARRFGDDDDDGSPA
jgi:ABC-type spermidine/putrescine transport system permease subunit II